MQFSRLDDVGGAAQLVGLPKLSLLPSSLTPAGAVHGHITYGSSPEVPRISQIVLLRNFAGISKTYLLQFFAELGMVTRFRILYASQLSSAPLDPISDLAKG